MIDNNIQPNGNQLKALRDPFGVSQAEFASQMGMPLRTYEDLEGGKARVRPAHIRAAEMACLQLAYQKNDAAPLSEKLRVILRALGPIVSGG